MSYSSIASRPLTYLVVAGLALGTAVIVGKVNGLAGIAIGLASGCFGTATLWQVIQLISTLVVQGRSSALGTTVTIIALLAKLPVYIVAWQLAERLGDPAPGCFLAGVGLVYSCLVAWAIARP